MEKYIRFYLANFMFETEEQEKSHKIYLENSKKLQETICVVQEKIAHCKKDIKNLCATTGVRDGDIYKHMSFFIHNNEVFLGFFKPSDNKITFIESDLCLQKEFFADIFPKLEQNMLDAIDRSERGQEQILMNKQMQEKWNETIPLLDKIQQIDKELLRLPEKEYDRIHHTLEYDDFVSELIEQYENLDYLEMINSLNNMPNPFIKQYFTKENIREQNYFKDTIDPASYNR